MQGDEPAGDAQSVHHLPVSGRAGKDAVLRETGGNTGFPHFVAREDFPVVGGAGRADVVGIVLKIADDNVRILDERVVGILEVGVRGTDDHIHLVFLALLKNGGGVVGGHDDDAVIPLRAVVLDGLEFLVGAIDRGREVDLHAHFVGEVFQVFLPRERFHAGGVPADDADLGGDLLLAAGRERQHRGGDDGEGQQ